MNLTRFWSGRAMPSSFQRLVRSLYQFLEKVYQNLKSYTGILKIGTVRSVYQNCKDRYRCLKANFQSAEFSERAEILLFTRANVVLKLNR